MVIWWSAPGPGCVKTPPLSDGSSGLQMQCDMPLISRRSENALLGDDWRYLKT